MRNVSSLALLLLLTGVAVADPPPAPAPAAATASPSRTEDLLVRIVRAIESLEGRLAQPIAVRWEYRCTDVGTMQSEEAQAAMLNELGSQGWEWTGVLSPSMVPTKMRVCFKRPTTSRDLSPVAGELGCSPGCGQSDTCYKGVCVAACTSACPADQFCSNDRQCRTRTRPRH